MDFREASSELEKGTASSSDWASYSHVVYIRNWLVKIISLHFKEYTLFKTKLLASTPKKKKKFNVEFLFLFYF